MQDIGREISVCLLTYNHAHMIEKTLASIQKQTLSGYEIIVSDDCSTDDTWAILQRMAATDPRIRPIRPPQNLGMAGNANFAVSQSERPYIALLHHDDLYRPDLLEKWVRIVARHDDVGFVFNPYGVENSAFVWQEAMPGEYVEGRWFLEKFLLPRWGCPVRGTAMVRRSAWQDVEGMRLQYNLLADVDLWMRLSRRWAVGYVDEPIITLRQERPEDYPEEYKATAWSWKRQRYLYEIHIDNRLELYRGNSIGNRLRWFLFRLRMARETAKWLSYAVVRKRSSMLLSSEEGATRHDLWPLRIYRRCLRAAAMCFWGDAKPRGA